MSSFTRTYAMIILVSAGLIAVLAKPQQIKPGCRYEGRRYQEGTSVGTSEPCLQCRCIEGSLRCRLRVCPRLPKPPPPGCQVRSPGENVCCSELVCGESDVAENIIARGIHEPPTNLPRTGPSNHIGITRESKSSLPYGTPGKKTLNSLSAGCLYEGVRYAPGSAMMSSSRCEYCYCISGDRKCVRPKCLLPLPGCAPLYAPHSCCPVAYNCTRQTESSTTLAANSGYGCKIGDQIYQEGEMVRDTVWKATCDNCFCAMGLIRCVPLACAPPLQGCEPIVREGQCCPSTYNCSGTIEVQASQNYASYAFISKDYAKFRKETNFYPAIHDSSTSTVEGRGHRVVSALESSTPDIVTEESSVLTDPLLSDSTFRTEPIDNEILTETTEYPKQSTQDQEQFTTTASESFTTAEFNISDQTVPNSEPPKDEVTTFREDVTTDVEESTLELMTTTDVTTTITERAESSSIIVPGVQDRENVCKEANCASEDKIGDTTSTGNPVVTTSNASNEMGVDKGKKKDADTLMQEEDQVPVSSIKKPIASLPTSIIMPDDTLVMSIDVKTNVSVGSMHGASSLNPVRTMRPDIEAILNMTNRKSENTDFDEYDYSEPTLPPSLPNVRIIPFVAADAIAKDEDAPSTVTGYPSGVVGIAPELRHTDANFYDVVTQENRFSPPDKTEGGFVPRNPSYFDPIFHSPDLNLEIGAGVTVLPNSISISLRKSDDLASSCLYDGREYNHGDSLPSSIRCVICLCYSGEVVCSDQKCPPLKIGCRRVQDSGEQCCGKIICVDAAESPTVVLDRADATAASKRQPTLSPDPFRDVIKTEPAPDLPSLIGDMIPYFAEHGITTQRTTTPLAIPSAFIKGSTSHQSSLNSNLRPNFEDFIDGITPPHQSQTYNHRFNVEHSTTPKNTRPPTKIHRVTQSTPIPAKVQVHGDETESIVQPNDSRIEFVTNQSISITTSKPEVDDEEDSLLSSVLNFLFSEESKKTDETTRIAITTTESIPTTTSPPINITEISTTTETTTEVTTRLSEIKIPVAQDGLVKLAGCNIFGEEYQVGRIITKMTDSCTECRCTEIGVHCEKLDC